MHSDNPAAAALSQIRINFGEQPTGQTSAIDFKLSAQYCSSKTQNKRFNAGEYLNTQIPSNSVLFEIQAKDDGEDLANKLNEIRKKSDSMKSLEEDKQVKIKIVGKGNKVFILLISDQIQQFVEQINNGLQTSQMAPTQQKWLDVKISSRSTLEKIRKTMADTGTLTAFLDSLSVIIRFNKTRNIQNLVKKMLTTGMNQGQADSLVSSFEHINLDLQFQSSQVLANYSKLAQQSKKFNMNDDFKQIRSLLGNKLEIFVFGKPLSISGSLVVEDLYLALDILFA